MTDIESAQQLEPMGAKCAFCGKDNDFADDCGWFYIQPVRWMKISHPVCESCYRGEPGRLHVARFGLGER